MIKFIKIIVGITLVLIACLLHNFYISYHYARENFIVSWPASSGEYHAFINEYAKSLVRQDVYKSVEIPSSDERFERRKKFIRDYCSHFNFEDSEGGNRWQRSLTREFALLRPEHYRCRKEWVEPNFVVRKILAAKGMSLDEAITRLKRNNPSIEKGMTPSVVSAGEIPSRTAMARSLWLGVVVPIALLIVGFVLLLMGLMRPKRVPATPDKSGLLEQPQLQARRPEAGELEPYEPQQQREKSLTLGEEIKRHFGKEIGIAGGNAKRDDPLIITETVDYVSIEYAVAKFLMQDQEYKKEKQQLFDFNGRKVDELVFATKSVGASEWESIRRFYFDITAGYSQIGK